jgi:hypothetical protein
MNTKTQHLDDDEIAVTLAILKKRADGIYRLRDLFEELWAAIQGPTDFGIRFKRAVRAGQIAGIRLGWVTAQNHQVYVVAS